MNSRGPTAPFPRPDQNARRVSRQHTGRAARGARSADGGDSFGELPSLEELAAREHVADKDGNVSGAAPVLVGSTRGGRSMRGGFRMNPRGAKARSCEPSYNLRRLSWQRSESGDNAVLRGMGS